MILEVTTEEVTRYRTDDVHDREMEVVACIVFRPVWWHDRGITWNGTTDWMAVWGPPWNVPA